MAEKVIDGATGLETDSHAPVPEVPAEKPVQTDEQEAEELRRQIEENSKATENDEPEELTPEREEQILEHLGLLDAGRQAAVIIQIRKAEGKNAEKEFVDRVIADKRMPKPLATLPKRGADEISRRMG